MVKYYVKPFTWLMKKTAPALRMETVTSGSFYFPHHPITGCGYQMPKRANMNDRWYQVPEAV